MMLKLNILQMKRKKLFFHAQIMLGNKPDKYSYLWDYCRVTTSSHCTKIKQKYPRYALAALFDQAVLRVTSAPLSREHVSASFLASIKTKPIKNMNVIPKKTTGHIWPSDRAAVEKHRKTLHLWSALRRQLLRITAVKVMVVMCCSCWTGWVT